LTADHACYAFQVAEYAKHFTCISLDLRGTGESDNPEGVYSTEVLADDIAAFMQAVGIPRAHISGLSLGAAIGMWLAAKYPDTVTSLSLHSGWAKTDAFMRTVVEGLQVMAKAMGSVPEMVILALFPWCLTPELYAAKPDYIKLLADFVRSRPAQSVASFMQQSNEQDRGSYPDNVRAARRCDLHSLCGSHERENTQHGAIDFRGLCARTDLRECSGVQR
jgi:pimeloyl-ACP methyl ester carboxylesterase